MAGLVSAELQKKLGPGVVEDAPRDPPVEDYEEGEEEPNVTPEEQQALEDFVADGLLLVYEGGEVRESILELLDDDPSDLIAILGDVGDLKEKFTPSLALAATAVVIVLELLRRAGDARPDDAIILHGGKEILLDLANLADEAGIHDFTQEETNRAWYLAMDLYRESAAAEGLIDTEQLKAEFEAIRVADAEGQFAGAEAEPVPMMGGR